MRKCKNRDFLVKMVHLGVGVGGGLVHLGLGEGGGLVAPGGDLWENQEDTDITFYCRF